MVRAMAPGIIAAFGALLRGGQDRKNLEADRAVVEGMLQTGLTNFRYRGVAMEFEAFADAHQEEIERLVTNTVNAMLKADSAVDWSKVNWANLTPSSDAGGYRRRATYPMRLCKDLWARLLAGELESPGSVSKRHYVDSQRFEQGTRRGISNTMLGVALLLGRTPSDCRGLWEPRSQFVAALWIVVRCSNAIGSP